MLEILVNFLVGSRFEPSQSDYIAIRGEKTSTFQLIWQDLRANAVMDNNNNNN